MKTKPRLLFTGLCFLLFLSACAPTYVPNVVNTPFFSNKSEFQAGLYAGTSGFDPQIAYAVTDHVGLMLNASFDHDKSLKLTETHKHSFVEIGAGYYTPLGENWRFETFGGIGAGSITADYESDLWQTSESVSNTRIFIQPDIGISGKLADFGFGTRFVHVRMYQDPVSNSGLFMEPVMTLRMGFKHIKAFGQMGLSFPLNEDQIDFALEPIIFSIGIHARFGKK